MSTITLVEPDKKDNVFTVHAVSTAGELFTHTSEASTKTEAIADLLSEVDKKGWGDQGFMVTEVIPSRVVQEFTYKYERDPLLENMISGDK